MEISEVSLNNINLTLDKKILSDISLRVNPGIHCFLGPNGAGKTMTNKILGLLMQPTNGTVKWDDEIVNPYDSKEEQIRLIRNIGYMNQKPTFLNNSVRYNIALPLVIREINAEKRRQLVDEKIEEFNLTDFADRNIKKLSYGQKQKVALARALIHNPSLIIMDEPTASLDIANIKWFESHIKKISEQKNVIIFWTTHDQFQAKRIGDMVSIIISGRLRVTNTVEKIFNGTSDPLVGKYLSGELF